MIFHDFDFGPSDLPDLSSCNVVYTPISNLLPQFFMPRGDKYRLSEILKKRIQSEKLTSMFFINPINDFNQFL